MQWGTECNSIWSCAEWKLYFPGPVNKSPDNYYRITTQTLKPIISLTGGIPRPPAYNSHPFILHLRKRLDTYWEK